MNLPYHTVLFASNSLSLFLSLVAVGIKGADVQENPNAAFSHQYQVNSALALAGRLKGKPGAPANPRAAAEAIIAAYNALPEPCPLVGKLEIAGEWKEALVPHA